MRTAFFTGKGDEGESHAFGAKTSKAHPLVIVLGGMDELGSWLGFCRVEAERWKENDISISETLFEMQNTLFTAQAEVAGIRFEKPAKRTMEERHTAKLEALIEAIDGRVPPLTHFVIAGGTGLAARLDVARAVARRVEREAKAVSETHPLPVPVMSYLNRLSSALFALARLANHEAGVKEQSPTYE